MSSNSSKFESSSNPAPVVKKQMKKRKPVEEVSDYKDKKKVVKIKDKSSSIDSSSSSEFTKSLSKEKKEKSFESKKVREMVENLNILQPKSTYSSGDYEDKSSEFMNSSDPRFIEGSHWTRSSQVVVKSDKRLKQNNGQE
jgi:hypothetical protein